MTRRFAWAALVALALFAAPAASENITVTPAGGGGSPTGAAGGDLGGTYPNPAVTNGSHITNASIPNSGLATPAPCAAFGTTAGTCLQGAGALGTPSSGNAANLTMPAAVPQTLGQSHIPFVLVSSGTMGNNGALSGLTAVATTYPNAYVWMPAGAISSGSLAGWYYATFSSATAATVFNNTYTSGTPAIPGSPTAFVTTGPGAYTQTTGSNIAAYTLSIPGNTIGVNGSINLMVAKSLNNSAGAKTLTANYSSYAFATQAGTTQVGGGAPSGFSNRGVANVQVPLVGSQFNANINSVALVYGTIDSTSAQNLVINLQLATATDTMTLENIVVQLIPGVP